MLSFLVCFHFLPLLHKMPAISHRHGVQLSWSIPSILRFHSRTLLNPGWARREKKYNLFLCFFLSCCTQAWRSEVSIAITGHVSQSPLPSFLMWAQQLHGTADLTEIWRFRNGFSRLLTPSLYTDHWQRFILWLKGSKTLDNETVSPTTPGQL